MTSARLSTALLCLAALLPAACAGASPPPPVPGAGPGGDERLAAGDFDGAAFAYERQLSAGGDSAVLREKLANARWRAGMAHAAAAVRAADAGDEGLAQSELSRAEAFAPEAPAVRDAKATIEPRLAARRQSAALRDHARSLLSTDPQQAERLLADAQSVAGDGDVEIANLRREATLRAEADRGAERAAQAWDARDRERTLRELDGATFAGRAVAKADALRRRIEQDLLSSTPANDEAALRAAVEFAAGAELSPAVARLLRDRLVAKLLAAADDLRQTRRPCTGALLEVEAKRLRGDVKTPALDLVRERTTTTVLVRTFDDATGGKVDGMRLARALRERIALDAAGGGQALRALEDSDANRSAYPNALAVTGSVSSARTSEGRVGRETREVEYQSGTRREPNPRFAELAASLEQAAAALRRAQDEQKSAAGSLSALRATGFQKGADGRPRLGDVEFQTRLAAAQSRADDAERAVKRATDAEFEVRQSMQATPREVDVPVRRRHEVTVTTRVKTSQLTAEVSIAAGDFRDAGAVSADATHKETIAEGFAPGGIAADPDETPDDAEMAARVADRFAALASGRVRAAAENAVRHLLVEARDAERAGRRDDAAELYAMYLLSTPDVVSPERADAARALREVLGVHVALRTGARKEPK